MRYHVKFYHNYKFEWDKNKDKKNVEKHQISFHQARTVFESPDTLLTESDDLHSQYEQRYKTIGYSKRGKLLTVIHTNRENIIRIISARKSTKSERMYCHRKFGPLSKPRL